MLFDLFKNIPIQTAAASLAGLVGLVRLARFSNLEKAVIGLIWLNVVADWTSLYLRNQGISTHLIYNFLVPIEQVLSLLLWLGLKPQSKSIRNGIYGGILLITGISLISFGYLGLKTFHYHAFVGGSLVVIYFSYRYLKDSLVQPNLRSSLLFWLNLANFVYFSLSVSFISAVSLALHVSNDLALLMVRGNYIAYIIWCCVLLTGISWKKASY